MIILRIMNWFAKAYPEPNERVFNTQVGVHIEEFTEGLRELATPDSDDRLLHIINDLEAYADDLKSGDATVSLPEENRVNFLKELSDVVVTSVAVAYQAGLDIESALEEVAASNESKFDVDGNPIFDDNKKIIKGPHYWKPDLRPFV